MKLFTVGLLLFVTTSSVFGWYKKEPKPWYPGPELPPPQSPESDYVKEAALQAGNLKDWYLQETKQFLDGPGNKLPQSPNNFYFYVVQNFFLGKPASSSNGTPGTIVSTCRKNKDCKSTHHCVKGVCELQPEHRKPQKCKVDQDCQHYLSKSVISNFHVFCDHGQCNLGHRKPNAPEVQMCIHFSDCINGGECRNHRCVPRDEGTTKAPKKPLVPEGPCKVDRDCKTNVPNGLMYLVHVYCDNGQCKRGRRPTTPSTSKPRSPTSPTSIVGCHNGICTDQSLPIPRPHSRQCKIDRDCDLKLPGGFNLPIQFIPFYCDEGHCKHGHRKSPNTPEIPATPEHQFCRFDFQCINGGRCQSNRCVPNHDATKAPLIPYFPHPHSRHCKIDRDCEYELPGEITIPIPFMPMYCNEGLCKHGHRKPEITSITEAPDAQICKFDFECINGGKCQNYRCVVNENPLKPFHPYPTKCKVDRDCEYELPGEITIPIPFMPMYCNEGLCKHGHRKPEITAATVAQETTKAPLKPFNPHFRPCQVDYDCRIKLPNGVRLPIPYYCNKGRCNMGVRKHNDTEVTVGPIEVVTTASTPSSNDVTTKNPSPFKCQTNKDCIGVFKPYIPGMEEKCIRNHCVAYGAVPAESYTTTKKPLECKSHSDCYQHDIVCGGARYCKNGRCHSQKFSVSMDILIPASKKPCKDDSGCFAHSIICGVPHRCESSQCVSQSSTSSPSTKVPAIQQDSTPSTRTTKKPRNQCHTDRDCNGHSKIQFLPARKYCDAGVCKYGHPSVSKTSTTQQASTPSITTKKPKNICHSDKDCPSFVGGNFPRYGYCDKNGECKYDHPSTRKTSTTKQTPTTAVTTTAQPTVFLPKQCKTDYDCVQNVGFQHKALVNVFCHNGHCALNKSPTSTVKPSESPTTVAEKLVTRDLHYCNVNNDCAPFTPLETVATCYNHHCYIGDDEIYALKVSAHPEWYPTKKVTTSPSTPSTSTTKIQKPIEPTQILITSRPLESLPSTKPHEKKCKHDSDCYKLMAWHSLMPVKCINGKCLSVPRTPNAPIVQTSVAPVEDTTTKKPVQGIKCKSNSDCRGLVLGHHLRCEHGKCVIADQIRQNSTVQTSTAKPHSGHSSASEGPKKHTTSEHHDHHPSTTTTKKVQLLPESVTVSSTPHVYSCRRNRDCKNFPHPKNMPVYCEHRICKHGNRRPRNDFDTCKIDSDCTNGEGPCVNGFCSRPRHHKKSV
uniref:C3H1-type domain-containing protein n=1 Tax=Panagrolaimus sp. ES5 TaxID=591445 RepID=A0AC34GPN2_9BILA